MIVQNLREALKKLFGGHGEEPIWLLQQIAPDISDIVTETTESGNVDTFQY